MGLDLHAYNFLKYITKDSYFLGKTLTLGRQEDHLPNRYRLINPETGIPEKFCENTLIKLFNASEVHSLDGSNYENATFVQDLNKPWKSKDLVKQQYSTILDFGTLEHVFNIPQALNSIANSCEIGGRIVHVQVHSDFCGHGLYQFSTDLFFNWYSQENGFEDVEIFIAPFVSPNIWFRCLRPKVGDRCELTGRYVPNSYILVKAKKAKNSDNRDCIQSYYLPESLFESKSITKFRKNLFSDLKNLIPISFRIKLKSYLYKYRILSWWKSNYLVREELKDLLRSKIND